MLINTVWPQLTYHKEQYSLWTCPKRWVYVPAGRQSGKTELSMRHLVAYLPIKKPWPDPRYFYAAPTFNQAKKVAWRRLLNLIPAHWVTNVSQSELTIQTIFGSELFIVGLDIPHRIEGRILDGGVIDESCDIKPGTFDHSILGTLVTRHGWCWFTGVCKRFGVGAKEFRERYEAAVSGDLPDSAGFTWPSSGIVTEEELGYARAVMDERDFDEQFNASWLNASGGIFHSFDKDYNVRPCIYDPSLPIIVGSDYNVDPMAWVLCHRKGETLEVFDELFIRNTHTEATLKVMLNRYANHKSGFEMYGDASSRARKTSASSSDYIQIASDGKLKKFGRTLHYSKGNPPIADRFAVTNARICNGNGVRNVFIDPKCKHLIYDLETRTYVPGTRDIKDVGDSGHASDALGYILWKLWPLALKINNRQIVTIRTGK